MLEASIDLSHPLRRAAATLAVAVTLFGAHSATAAPTASPACETPKDIANFFDPDDSVAYGYSDDQAARIVAVLTSRAAAPPPGGPPSEVFVGIDITRGEIDFFLYDASGCRTAHIGPMDTAAAVDVLHQANVQVLFGPPLPTERT